jgi:exopolysaccharide biosynthesis polyprenyl glycosylphosphotransferase
MFRRHSVNYAILSLFMDLIMAVVALLLAWWIRPNWPWAIPLPGEGLIPAFFWWLVPVTWLAVGLALGIYDPSRMESYRQQLGHVTRAALFCGLVLAGLVYLTYRETSRWLLILIVVLLWASMAGWRLVAVVKAPKRRRNGEIARVLIVGAGVLGREVASRLQAHTWCGLEFVGYLDDNPAKVAAGLPVLGSVDRITDVVREHDINEVVVTLPLRAWERLSQTVAALHALPVHVRIVPDYFSLALHRADFEEFAGVPMIDLRAPALSDYQRLVKRTFDLAVGGTLFLLTLPLYGIIALAVKLDSRGPVLFRQQRVGENGRLFDMLKFRSMYVGSEERVKDVAELSEDGLASYKRRDDPRVTRVGSILRRTSLDELPQLWNVLRGEMSLVGPRPELPWLVAKYELWQRKRFAVPQGMTGWWQINGRSDRPMYYNTQDDLYYVQNYSLLLDLQILLRTIPKVLRGEGAY